MQVSKYASKDKRKAYLEERITTAKREAIELFNKLEHETNNITSQYVFNQRVDELSRLILDIIYFTEIIDRYLPPEEIYVFKRQTPEERAYEIKEELERKRNSVKHALVITEQALNNIKGNIQYARLQVKLEQEKARILQEIERITVEMRVYEDEPDLTDGEINIYIVEENGLYFKGDIFLSNTPVCIGDIEYRGPDNGPWLGDIGYNIKPLFQGHNYAYKALELIKAKILELGIENVIITTNDDNIASQKIIEKFGGKRIESSLPAVYRYNCHLELELKEQPIIKH